MKKVLLIVAGLFIVLSLTGCGEETPGEKLDNAIDQTKEASKDAMDEAKKLLGD
jgi:predicted small lipoprotein YifL